jgi:hypothetical protein
MYAADIETENWDRFVVGGVLSDTDDWVCHDWHTEREFAEYLLSLDGEVWGHNAGRYDWLWLTDTPAKAHSRGFRYLRTHHTH